MPRPKGRGAARQNKRKDGEGLKEAWAGGNYHSRAAGSESHSDSEAESQSREISMRCGTLAPKLPRDLATCVCAVPALHLIFLLLTDLHCGTWATAIASAAPALGSCDCAWPRSCGLARRFLESSLAQTAEAVFRAVTLSL